MNFIARSISVIFHPLFFATYLFAAFVFILPMAWTPVPMERSWNMLLLIFVVTFLLPAINIFLFKMLGNIKSLQMEDRRERYMPFLFISFVYCAVTYMLHRTTGLDWTDNFLRFLMAIDALVVVATIITFFYKISIHSVAAGGLVGIFIPLNKWTEQLPVFYATLVVIVLAGVIMTARLQLNAHTPREVMTGGLVGMLVGFISIIVLFTLM